MNVEQAFAQGARCGHIEGQGRAGQYVIGEEIELAWDATVNQAFKNDMVGLVSQAWEQGYQHGYKRAAEGSELEPEYQCNPHQNPVEIHNGEVVCGDCYETIIPDLESKYDLDAPFPMELPAGRRA